MLSFLRLCNNICADIMTIYQFATFHVHKNIPHKLKFCAKMTHMFELCFLCEANFMKQANTMAYEVTISEHTKIMFIVFWCFIIFMCSTFKPFCQTQSHQQDWVKFCIITRLQHIMCIRVKHNESIHKAVNKCLARFEQIRISV